jgi:hypothetical protein
MARIDGNDAEQSGQGTGGVSLQRDAAIVAA